MTRGAAERRGKPARRSARTTRPPRASAIRRLWLPVALVAALALAIGVYAVAGRSGGGSSSAGPVAVLTTADFHALAFAPDDPDVVFFGHHNGIMRSADGGRTWRALVDRPNFDAMGLAVSGGGARQLYLAGHNIFQVSSDGGASWQPAVNNLPGTDIHGFAMSPDDPSHLYAFIVGHGAYRSPDGGVVWEPVGGRLPDDVMGLAAARGDPEMLFAGSMSAGVLLSADGGRTWTPLANGAGPRGVMAFAVDPSTRQTIYAGAEGGLYKTSDGGSSWNRLPFPGDNAVAIAVNPVRPNVVLAITVKDRKGLLFRSEDGGATWGQRT